MATIELSDEQYGRIEEFRAVVSAVMHEQFDTDACLALVFERGLDSMLRDILGSQEQAVLVESLQQLAAREPSAVSPYVAQMINNGARIRRFRSEHPSIGFVGRERDVPDEGSE